jgi:hypothetical protein
MRVRRVLAVGNDLRVYSAEAWAKYTGAADYDQDLHRDYLNHTVLVPSKAAGYQQLEMFVYLVDVPEDLGPPHLVPSTYTAGVAAKPNWFPRQDSTGSAMDHADGAAEFYERVKCLLQGRRARWWLSSWALFTAVPARPAPVALHDARQLPTRGGGVGAATGMG